LVAIVVGGGKLGEASGRAARDLGWPVLASYGMTEAASQIATQGLDAPYQTAPIPILPIWQTRQGAGGLLEISGPALFSGYLIGNTFIARTDPWHTTSDRVELSGNAIIPLGRADTLVKVLGELVDPEAIERELIALSAGKLVAGSFAVIALPDGRAENVLVPVFETTVDAAIIPAILALYQANAPGFRRLAAPRWLDRLPRTDLGKLRRGELAAHFAAVAGS
jgi:O-succinylbenzoic acid--CoA ligase